MAGFQDGSGVKSMGVIVANEFFGEFVALYSIAAVGTNLVSLQASRNSSGLIFA